MREVVLFLDEPAAAAIARLSGELARRGLVLTHQTPFSVAFAAPPEHAGGAPPAAAVRAGSGAGNVAPNLGRGTPGEGVLPPGTGQCAAVPMQLKPAWCRVWVTSNGEGLATEAAAALVDAERERSRRVEAETRALEAGIYSDDSWPKYAATLRSSLERAGADPAAIEAKIAAFKQRWDALGRKAAKAPPEEHLSA